MSADPEAALEQQRTDEIEEELRPLLFKQDLEGIEKLRLELLGMKSRAAEVLRRGLEAYMKSLKGEYDAATRIFNEMIDDAQTSNDLLAIAKAYNGLGVIDYDRGDYHNAFEKFHKSNAYYKEAGADLYVGRTHLNIGNVHSSLSNYKESLEHSLKSLQYIEKEGTVQEVSNVMNSIGGIYVYMKDYERALEYLHKAQEMTADMEETLFSMHVTAHIAQAHKEMGDYAKSIELFKKVRQSADDFDYLRMKVGGASMLAEVYELNGDLDEALKLLDEEADLIAKHPEGVATAGLTRGRIYTKREQFDDAERELTTSYTKFLESGNKSSQINALEALRDMSRAKGDFEGYIEYNDKVAKLEDEVRSQETTKQLMIAEREREMQEQQVERDRERAVLYGALPKHVADRLIRGEDVTDHVEEATVLFLDIAGFTRISSKIPAGHVVHLLESVFGACDEVCQKHGLTKVKTIGDSYMAVAGVPDRLSDHASRAAHAAIEIQNALTELQVTMPPELGDPSWVKDVGEIHVRVGLHCGPVVAGVVGKDRLQYDVWGDTVNVASRMESTGEPKKIHASSAFVEALGETELEVTRRVALEVKGKGMMQTHWISGTES